MLKLKLDMFRLQKMKQRIWQCCLKTGTQKQMREATIGNFWIQQTETLKTIIPNNKNSWVASELQSRIMQRLKDFYLPLTHVFGYIKEWNLILLSYWIKNYFDLHFLCHCTNYSAAFRIKGRGIWCPFNNFLLIHWWCASAKKQIVNCCKCCGTFIKQ